MYFILSNAFKGYDDCPFHDVKLSCLLFWERKFLFITGGHPLQLDQVEHLYYYYLQLLSNGLFKLIIFNLHSVELHVVALLHAF